MSRKSARENVFRLVYEYSIGMEENQLTFDALCASNAPEDREFTKVVYEGIMLNFDFLKGVIKRYSPDFTIDRIYKVDLAVMIISVYEILFREDIPYTVSVNEALELVKVYSTDKSTTFVNGILATVIKNKEELKNECESN